MEDAVSAPIANREQRKTLAVDPVTYEMLARVCADQRRSKITQLRMLIEDEFDRLDLSLED
jgi:uncharacterized protein YqfB (UPF0267 family)